MFRFFESAARRSSRRLRYWLQHHPIASNSLLTLNLWVAGDSLAQYSEARLLVHENNEGVSSSSSSSTAAADFFSEEMDWNRTAKCASFGALVTGPILAVWYPFLDRLCLRYNVAASFGSAWAAPIAKVLADEFLMDPPTLALFFGYMSVWEEGAPRAWETFKAKMETQFLPSWGTSLAVWPWVLLGTFRFLPVHTQAPAINVCCIAWDAFLSHRNVLGQQQK